MKDFKEITKLSSESWNRHIEENKLLFLFEDPLIYKFLVNMKIVEVYTSGIFSVTGKKGTSIVNLYRSYTRPFSPNSKKYWVIYVQSNNSKDKIHTKVIEGEPAFRCLDSFPWTAVCLNI